MPLREQCPRGNKPCSGTNFKVVPDCPLWTSYQEIKVQEKTQCLGVGSMPGYVTAILLDEMADCCQPGGAPGCCCQ